MSIVLNVLLLYLQNSDFGMELRILEPRGSGSSRKWHMWKDSSVSLLRAKIIELGHYKSAMVCQMLIN